MKFLVLLCLTTSAFAMDIGHLRVGDRIMLKAKKDVGIDAFESNHVLFKRGKSKKVRLVTSKNNTRFDRKFAKGWLFPFQVLSIEKTGEEEGQIPGWEVELMETFIPYKFRIQISFKAEYEDSKQPSFQTLQELLSKAGLTVVQTYPPQLLDGIK